MYVGFYEIAEEKPFTYKSKTQKGEELEYEYVEVTFKEYEGKEEISKEIDKETFSKEVFELVKTEEPTDFDFVRDKRLELAGEDVFRAFLKHCVKIEELQTLNMRVQNNLQQSSDKSQGIVWGVEPHNKTFLDIDKVLTK